MNRLPSSYIRKTLSPPSIKGIVRKKDKRGRNLCYDDDSGKRVRCSGSASAPRAQRAKKQRASAEFMTQAIDFAIKEGLDDGKFSKLTDALIDMTVADLTKVRRSIGSARTGRVKQDIISNIKERIQNWAKGPSGQERGTKPSKKDKKQSDAYNTLKKLLGDNIDKINLGDPKQVADALRNALKEKESGQQTQAEPDTSELEPEEQGGESGAEQSADERGGGDETGEVTEATGGGVEEEATEPGATEASGGRDNQAQSTIVRDDGDVPTTERVPRSVDEVNKRIDRFQQFFNSKGQHHVAEWLGRLRDHINTVGTDEALQALGASPEPKKGQEGDVQYWGVGTEENNWKHMGHFIEAYLARNGIIAVTGDTSDPDLPLISALGKPDKYVAGDFKPSKDTFKHKLEEAQHLPGLEKSEDMSKLMGKPITHLNDEVIKKLNETYGDGKWIVKCYDDNAAAGYGIFFPQRAAAIAQEARNTIWTAGENVSKYGFELNRDKDGKVIGLKHSSGDTYDFGTEKYNNTINGDVRYWSDRAAAAANHEKGAMLPEGAFMAQPAFEAVGISDAERAAGKTWHEKNEGRVHLVTRPDGTVEVIPHSTWLKGGNLPVVFEDEDTKAMAKAAQEAINQLPPEARQGQVYAPDVMKTKDGYRVVELNAQGDHNGSGYLHDNHFTIDAYTSYLVGREPAHVSFIRNLLSKKKKDTKSLNGVRYEYVSQPSWVRVNW